MTPHPPTGLFGRNLVLHFGYHKCLTLFYVRLMKGLSAEFGFGWHPVYDDVAAFAHAVHGSPEERVVLLTDTDDIGWDDLPEYRASHVIRDPRDIVVSGYFYHLWTKEAWAHSTDFDWASLKRLAAFDLVEPDARLRPDHVSYQTYLNTLDVERGMLMEMVSRYRTFEQMMRWDFNNPRVLELRYEDFIGNEVGSCARLFDHYGFAPRLRERGLALVEQLGLNNQAKKERSHVRSGDSGQWRTHFTPRINEVFKQQHGDLLIRLGYERDHDW
jgi:hypothetical protein